VTKPAVTTTMTTTSTTNSTSVPSWAYGVMVVLLILGLAIGYVVAGPRLRGPSIRTGALSPR
jgi:cobalamin biosynthesis Mg chelatase CobN